MSESTSNFVKAFVVLATVILGLAMLVGAGMAIGLQSNVPKPIAVV